MAVKDGSDFERYLSRALKDFLRNFRPIFSLFSRFFWPILVKLGLRDENIGRDLHFAPVDGPRSFLKKLLVVPLLL